MLKELRKKLKLDSVEIDTFLETKNKSAKYYIEDTFLENKSVRYLIFLRLKGVDINRFFDEIINNNFNEYKL